MGKGAGGGKSGGEGSMEGCSKGGKQQWQGGLSGIMSSNGRRGSSQLNKN
jgi:hypothetical protein